MNKTRFSRKCEQIFWLVIQLLPVIVYFIGNYRNSAAQPFFEFIEGFSPFAFITDIMNNVSNTAFNTEFKLNSYLGYIVGVEIFKCLYNVIIFIPRLANGWINKAVQND